MAKSKQKTVAIKLLEGKKISFEQYSYPPDQKDAVLVAEAIDHPPAQVFKTLVVQPPDDNPKSKWSLAVIPSNTQLDLKKMAKAIGVKKVKMATHAQAEKVTGLQVGGISAVALLNKGFRVYLDQSATQFEQIVMSAGERGTQIKFGVNEFTKLTRAKLVDIASA